MSSSQLHILGNILIGRVEKKRSTGEVERRESGEEKEYREGVQEKWRGERVVEKRKIRKIRVEERKCSIIYWTPGE